MKMLFRNVTFFFLVCAWGAKLWANVPGGVVSGTGTPVTLTAGSNGPTLSNGIAQIVCTTSGAVINQINYTYNNGSGTVTKQMLLGGKDGGELYWEYGGFGGSTWTYTDVVDPSSNGGSYAEVAFTSLASGTAAEGDLQVTFSMLRGSPGFYVTLTMTHHSGDIATGLGEMRTNIYIAPDFNWMSVSPVVQRELGINASFVPAFDSPQENSLCISGVNQGLYDDKYKFSEPWGAERVWGWGSINDAAHGVSSGANVGIWNVLASSEYYNGGPLKPELMDAPMVNMLNGGHYYMGTDSNWGLNEQWTRVQGPYFVYLNNIPKTITDPVQASQALYNDAVAQAAAEVSGTPVSTGTEIGPSTWPYSWLNNSTYSAYYAHAAQRGTVTGQIVINDPGNPNASGSNMWVGVVQQASSPDGVYDFQEWYKPYQFWVKADNNGNFTIPAVISGTSAAGSGAAETTSYTLYAFGPGAEGTFMSQNQSGGNPPLLYNLPATPFGVTVTGGSTTNLGSVVWTPTRVGPTVFEIGYPDRTGHKFRHGDDWWVGDIGPSPTQPSPVWTKFFELPFDFPNGVNYAVGVNQWPTDWFFIQPILVSTTGGNNSSSSNINFNLASAPVAGGSASLYLGIASDYYGAVIVTVNGTNLGSTGGVTATPHTIPASGFIPSYTSSDASIRESANAAFSDERVTFPASLLKSGSNNINLGLRQIGGSYFANHFMYDYIRLELTGYVPPPPAGVVGYPGNGSVLLSWPVTPGATSYNVERTTTSGNNYATVASGIVGPVCGSGPTNATYLDTTASNGVTYYYAVQSANPTGASASSPASNGIAPNAGGPSSAPTAPTGLTVSATNGAVVLSWAASSGANYYTVLRSTLVDKIPIWTASPTLTSTSTILSTITLSNTVTGLSYVDKAVTNGTKYAYSVMATNAAGPSGTSGTIVAKPVPASAPGAPTNVSVVPSSGQVTINWPAVPGAVGYIIQESTKAGGPYTYVTTVSDLTDTITGLTNNTTYYFVISAENANGVSPNSTQSIAVMPPSPPGGLTATPGNTQITLTWPAVSGATGYDILRSTVNGGPYTLVGSGSGVSFTNQNLTNGTPYYYVVESTNAAGPGTASVQAMATPSASYCVAPGNLTATAGNGEIALSWGASAGVTTYQLMRSTSNGGPYSALGQPSTTTTGTDIAVGAGVTYYYVVVANNAAGASAYSNQASANLSAAPVRAWTGSSSSAWDTVTANWMNSGSTATVYVDGDDVVFPDSAVTGTVSIAAAVSPGGVNFTNSILNYVVKSTSAGISGTGGVTMEGAAEVLVTGSESYGGGTAIYSGTYALGADSSTSASTVESPGLSGGTNASLGSSSGMVYVTGGGELRFGGAGSGIITFTTNNPIVVAGGTILAADGVQVLTGGLTVNSGGANLLSTWNNKNLVINSAFNGLGNVVIDDWQAAGDTTGGVVVVETASNSYSGTITINPPSIGYLGGVLELTNNTALMNATIIDNNTSTNGLTFTINAPQIGALGGSGEITIPSGGLTVGGDGASTTYSGVLSGAGGLTKAGAGTMILTGSNTYTGVTTVTGGILEIIGKVAGSTSLSVSTGAVLYLNGGTISIAGSITNNGIVKLSGSAALSLTGAFTNNGVLDLINGPQILPSGFVNDGTVLNASSVRVQQIGMSESGFALTIDGYPQHTYQLQNATSLTTPINWTNVGSAQTGTGGTMIFSDPTTTGSGAFYRILVSP
jgi:autotransporter-associated beta strand protein